MAAFIDFETYSECDLRKFGVYVYARDPSTEILCMAYRIGRDGEDKLWERGDSPPLDLFDYACQEGAEFHAHNAAFERLVWDGVCTRMGWPALPADIWWCTAAQVAIASLPRALGAAGKWMELDVTKDSEGKNVMLRLCKPKPVRKKRVKNANS